MSREQKCSVKHGRDLSLHKSIRVPSELKPPDMATATGFKERINDRGKIETFIEGEHIGIRDLKEREDLWQSEHIQKYLSKDIKHYPSPVEFHVTEVAHVTNKTSLQGIWESNGFKGCVKDSLSWWSLKINEEDVRSAEERYLKTVIPDMSEKERAAQEPFLHDFTTSPVFLNNTSRYGNFRFTFPLTGLMEAYKKQMCEGEEPVLRVYETKLFRQEIEYVILIHGPKFNEKFSRFPLLTSNPLVSFDGKKIIWRAQAICETHNWQLHIIERTAEKKKMTYEYYVWDQVSLAFHMDGVLTFSKGDLRANLECCQRDKIDLSNGENCRSIEEAEKVIEILQDDDEKDDDKEQQTPGDVPEEEDVKEEPM